MANKTRLKDLKWRKTMGKIDLNEVKDLMIKNINSLKKRIIRCLKEEYTDINATHYDAENAVQYDVKVTDVLNCDVDIDTLTLVGDNEATFECSALVNVIFIPSDKDEKYYSFDEETSDSSYEEGETYFDETMTIEFKYNEDNILEYRVYK